MRRAVLILACLVGLVAGSLAGAAAVLASGTSTSAGDQQYVDPLTGSSTTSHSSGSSSSGSSSGSSSSGSTASSSGSSASQPTATAAGGSSSSSGTSAASASAHGGALPFTGMNVWACVAVGVGMLAAGLTLRRIARLT